MQHRDRILQAVVHPRYLGGALLRVFSHWITNDEWYVKTRYRLSTGEKIDLDNPQTFNEKLNWLKLYDHNPLYTTMVDKYAVKQHVASIIGEQYIIPTIGCWDKAEYIEWDNLPNQFVLKCNHNSTVHICKDKSKFNKSAVIASLKKELKKNYFCKDREWPYKNVNRKVIAEKYMSDGARDLIDYKFFCFNGEPKYCQVIQDRNTKETIDFFDMDWNLQPFIGLNPFVENALKTPERPVRFDLMKLIAAKLSNGLPFARIDLYEINGQVFFGEITFFPASARGSFRPQKWDYTFGSWIKLPSKSC